MEPTEFRVAITSVDASGIGSILPDGVYAIEAFGEIVPDPLLAGEAEVVANAVEKRRLEFARGRTCARRALALLGISPVPVLCDDSRAPRWPAGVTGSITHCRDYCSAVVAPADRWLGIGIDAEVLHVLSPGVQNKIMNAAERRELATFDPAVPWACAVFSAKEAIYKACYPLVRRWIDFLDVVVHLSPADGRFTATVVEHSLAGVLPETIHGRFRLDGPRVVSVVAFTAS